MTNGQFVLLWARLALGVMLILSGLAKYRSPHSFRESIAQYRIVPHAAVRWVTTGIPLAELALGINVVVGLHTAVAGFGAGTLLTVFTGAMITVIRRGRKIACGCFGGRFDQEVGWDLVARNLLLVGVCGALAINPVTPVSLDWWLKYSTISAIPLGTAAVSLGMVLTVVVVFNLVVKGAVLMGALRTQPVGRFPPDY